MFQLSKPCTALPAKAYPAPPFVHTAVKLEGRHGCTDVRCQAKSSSGKKGSSNSRASSKGFGPEKAAKLEKLFEQDADVDESALDGGSYDLKPQYQMYTDPDYMAGRFVGPIEVGNLEGRGRGLVATTNILPGDLLVVSPALALVQGEFGTTPELEDLHVSMLEDGLLPAQRRVLDLLYDGTAEATQKAASLTSTLDPKFWAGRGKSDPQAPPISADKLMDVLSNCACSDTQQDAAAMQVRHQRPVGFVGLWPEFALLNHSCAPNTSATVINNRLLIHSTAELKSGQEFTRNYLGTGVAAPISVRQRILQDEFGFECSCARCRMEANTTEEVKEVLEAAHTWFQEEASVKWNEANENEDGSVLEELLEESSEFIAEIEDTMQKDPNITFEHGLWLMASAYDVYDMAVTCEELLHHKEADTENLLACLQIIKAIFPGSESHTQVALKYNAIMQERFELAEYLADKNKGPKGRSRTDTKRIKALAQEAEMSTEFFFEAMILRYGYISTEIVAQLKGGLETFIEGVEQLGMMAAEGATEKTKELEINGIKVSIVDRQEVSSSSSEGSGVEVSNKDGVRLMLVDEEDDEGEALPKLLEKPKARPSL